MENCLEDFLMFICACGSLILFYFHFFSNIKLYGISTLAIFCSEISLLRIFYSIIRVLECFHNTEFIEKADLTFFVRCSRDEMPRF